MTNCSTWLFYNHQSDDKICKHNLIQIKFIYITGIHWAHSYLYFSCKIIIQFFSLKIIYIVLLHIILLQPVTFFLCPLFCIDNCLIGFFLVVFVSFMLLLDFGSNFERKTVCDMKSLPIHDQKYCNCNEIVQMSNLKKRLINEMLIFI